MSYRAIEFSVGDNGVARLTLNRPAVRNAMNGDMYDEARAVVAQVDADPRIRVLVLTGAGEGFCAGGDFRYQQSQQSRPPAERIAEASKLALWLRELDTLSKPLVGRINGSAHGGGIGLVAVCDVAIAVDGAEFCMTEVSRGMLPSMVSPFVVRKMGISNARSVFLSARTFDAAQALRMGLLHEVVPAAGLDAAVGRQAGLFLRCAPGAIAATKRLLAFVDRHEASENLDYTVRSAAEMWATAEAAEGMQSFIEKRKPAWAR